MSKLNQRTIQRAEADGPVTSETLAFIAEAFEVSPDSLKGRPQDAIRQDSIPRAARRGNSHSRHTPVTRGSRLVSALRDAFMAKFEYEAEPAEDNVTLLEEIAKILNTAWENPWEPPYRNYSENEDVGLMRLRASANRTISSLRDRGIRIFLSTYPSLQQKPQYSIDDGLMYVRDNWPEERVTNARVVVSDETADSSTRFPDDHEDSEEIPF